MKFTFSVSWVESRVCCRSEVVARQIPLIYGEEQFGENPAQPQKFWCACNKSLQLEGMERVWIGYIWAMFTWAFSGFIMKFVNPVLFYHLFCLGFFLVTEGSWAIRYSSFSFYFLPIIACNWCYQSLQDPLIPLKLLPLKSSLALSVLNWYWTELL